MICRYHHNSPTNLTMTLTNRILLSVSLRGTLGVNVFLNCLNFIQRTELGIWYEKLIVSGPSALLKET